MTPDWNRLERDVVLRIRALAAICSDKLDAPEDLRAAIYRDLVLPNVRLLAEFCSAVRIDDEDTGPDEAVGGEG